MNLYSLKSFIINKYKLIFGLFFILVIVLFLFPVNKVKADTEYINIPITGIYNYDYAKQVLDLVNKERAKVGASPLVMDPQLFETAQLRASEIVIYFSHTRPDGTKSTQTAFPYSTSLPIGENIAAGQGSPSEVMARWMASSGHKANILKSSYTHIGIGCFVYDSRYYWVQCFGGSGTTKTNYPSNETKKVNITALSSQIHFSCVSRVNLKVGKTKELKVFGQYGSSSKKFVLDNSLLTWSNSNPSVASINNGIITALSAGQTTLSANTFSVTVKVTENVTVTPTPPSGFPSYPSGTPSGGTPSGTGGSSGGTSPSGTDGSSGTAASTSPSEITGFVWKDIKNSSTGHGDGKYSQGEQLIEGINVDLYKVIDYSFDGDGITGEDESGSVPSTSDLTASKNLPGEKVQTVQTDSQGKYSFIVNEPGLYRVEFRYGDNTQASYVIYNGHDYKSTNTSLTTTTDIRNTPIQITILVDLSSSMADSDGSIDTVKVSVAKLINNLLNNGVTDDVEIALLSYSIDCKTECEYTNDLESLYDAINNFEPILCTHTASGLKYAYEYMQKNKNPNALQMFLIYTDGQPEPFSVRRETIYYHGINSYALTLYQRYKEFEEATDWIDHIDIVDSKFTGEYRITCPLAGYGLEDINTFPITTYKEAEQDLIERTKNWWNTIKSDTSIYSFAIASDHEGTSYNLFKSIFGEDKTTFLINNDMSIIASTFENDIPTSIMDNLNNTQENISYAADWQYRRLEVMDYSQNIDYDKGTILNINADGYTNFTDFCTNTHMIATTPVFTVLGGGTCKNVNCAIEERPTASVSITKNVVHLKIILSDGRTLIDWRPSQNVKNLMVLPDSLTAIIDDELIHGANIQITYSINLYNTSEIDTLSNYFTENFLNSSSMDERFTNWYNTLNTIFGSTSINSIINKPVPTQYYIYDYLDNYSIFDEANSPTYWSVVSHLLPISSSVDLDAQTILEIHDLNNVINSLQPQSEAHITLELSTSKLMTVASSDLLTYNNYVEVVQYSSVLGRRMYYNIPGNLDITDEERVKNLEPDEAKAETVTCLPPFGKDLSYYTTVVGIIILAIEIVILSTVKIKIKHLRNNYIRR